MSQQPANETRIHATALIDPSAELDVGVTVGPYVVVEAHSRIGAGTSIGASATIGPWTTIGRNNRIYQHATVGSDSQALAFRPGDESYLIVGDENIIREFSTFSRASNPGGATRVGDRNCFMANAHVAHNCTIGNDIVFANSVAIGGFVEVEDYAILGGLVGVHQFCRIGRHAIVGCNSKVNRDVLPFITADGHPARPRGVNAIGLKRRQFSADEIRDLRQGYKIIFQRNHPLQDALELLRRDFAHSAHVAAIVEFAAKSARGILRPRKG